MAAYTKTDAQKNTLTAAGALAGLPQPLNLITFCITFGSPTRAPKPCFGSRDVSRSCSAGSTVCCLDM